MTIKTARIITVICGVIFSYFIFYPIGEAVSGETNGIEYLLSSISLVLLVAGHSLFKKKHINQLVIIRMIILILVGSFGVVFASMGGDMRYSLGYVVVLWLGSILYLPKSV